MFAMIEKSDMYAGWVYENKISFLVRFIRPSAEIFQVTLLSMGLINPIWKPVIQIGVSHRQMTDKYSKWPTKIHQKGQNGLRYKLFVFRSVRQIICSAYWPQENNCYPLVCHNKCTESIVCNTHVVIFVMCSYQDETEMANSDWHWYVISCVLFVTVVDFFNRINLLYGTVCEYCTEQTCPTMSGGPK